MAATKPNLWGMAQWSNHVHSRRSSQYCKTVRLWSCTVWQCCLPQCGNLKMEKQQTRWSLHWWRFSAPLCGYWNLPPPQYFNVQQPAKTKRSHNSKQATTNANSLMLYHQNLPANKPLKPASSFSFLHVPWMTSSTMPPARLWKNWSGAITKNLSAFPFLHCSPYC